MPVIASPSFAPPRGACSTEAHVVQSGVWFYVVGRDGGYVRADDEGDDEDSRPVSYGLREDAQTHADCLNAAAVGEA